MRREWIFLAELVGRNRLAIRVMANDWRGEGTLCWHHSSPLKGHSNGTGRTRHHRSHKNWLAIYAALHILSGRIGPRRSSPKKGDQSDGEGRGAGLIKGSGAGGGCGMVSKGKEVKSEEAKETERVEAAPPGPLHQEEVDTSCGHHREQKPRRLTIIGGHNMRIALIIKANGSRFGSYQATLR